MLRGKIQMYKYNLESISEKLIESVTELLEHFDIGTFVNNDSVVRFACPIHGGDNDTSCSIKKFGIGNWMCFSHQCHEKYGSANGASIIHFVQALLSVHHDREYSFVEALDWSANFVGENKTYIPEEEKSRTKFIQLCKYVNRTKTGINTFTPRKLVKNFLRIPADYYIKRGYTGDILTKFDIGYCFNQQKPFFDRIVTPFYDDDGEFMIGCSGRNKHEKCPKCNLYHQEGVRCPISKDEKMRAVKWKHNSNFVADSYLYNYWNARKHIANTYTAILVEGPGDVWRLEEAGIYNGLALLGAKLSTGQQIILEESGAINLIIATDNDDAGQKVANSIINNCNKLFNIQRVNYPTNDPGSLTVEQVKSIFLPILERI